ncbi:hypothetical protein [Sinimarinibacterium flocculans]|uniref:hypothetical protein n=1 Tax=Sinimarinibacterium flocculans TaxID=985250 RepID=UPI000D764542|nr:hypothetical protein [Sinimarinibacterium flocculans]
MLLRALLQPAQQRRAPDLLDGLARCNGLCFRDPYAQLRHAPRVLALASRLLRGAPALPATRCGDVISRRWCGPV